MINPKYPANISNMICITNLYSVNRDTMAYAAIRQSVMLSGYRILLSESLKLSYAEENIFLFSNEKKLGTKQRKASKK